MPETPRLTALAVADPPELWRELGFSVSGSVATVGTVAVHLGASGEGVAGWRVVGLPQGADLDGLPFPDSVDDGADDTGAHANGVASIDHLVVITPDLARTAGRIEDAGVVLRRIRRAGGDPPREQAFFRLGEVILEVVGPAAPAGGEGPARLWGLAFDCADLDATAAVLGDRLGPARHAVQEGKRIATLRREAGSCVPMAFMGPA